MRKSIIAAAGVVSGTVISYHVEATLDLVGSNTAWIRFVTGRTQWILDLVASKWTLAAAAFLLGLIVADVLLRWSLRGERKPSWWRLHWLNYKKTTILLKLRHRGAVPIDLQHELVTMDSALQSEGIELPALPTVDPEDPTIRDTEAYLDAIGPLSPDRLDEARRRAEMIAATPPEPREAFSTRVRHAVATLLGRRNDHL